MLYLDDYLDVATVDVIDWSPVLALRARDENHEAAYQALAGRHPALTVYRRQDLPARLHYQKSTRIAPIIGIAAEGWAITTRPRARASAGGDHGYDNRLPSMAGIFMARGPRLAAGRLPTVENIHVYELLCELAGINPARNDGSLEPWQAVLRPGSGR